MSSFFLILYAASAQKSKSCSYLYDKAFEFGARLNMRKQRFAEQICAFRIFTGLRELPAAEQSAGSFFCIYSLLKFSAVYSLLCGSCLLRSNPAAAFFCIYSLLKFSAVYSLLCGSCLLRSNPAAVFFII